jgi:hypothetical protein
MLSQSFNKLLFFVLFFCVQFYWSQQNTEFKSAKDYFDYQRYMLNNEFKKKFEDEPDSTRKMAIKKDFSEFMVKLDSIQNTAFIGTLIKVKNREDLAKLSLPLNQNVVENPPKTGLSDQANYPGGINTLRQQIADLFYSEAILPDQKSIKTDVVFVVERDGSITSVHAEGDHFAFNRQAEIAMYLLPGKFSPTVIEGTPVRYRFRLPLAMNFE